MALAEKLQLTAEEYLQGETTAEFKHEFMDGEVWAMVGASDPHVLIAMNIAFLLKHSLKNQPCRTYISDMKVKVAEANAFFYPDILVSCDSQDRNQRLYKEHPTFIAEVLSPSTEAFDRGRKFAAYRLLDSLQSYWLIDSQKKSVDCFERTAQGDWLLRSFTADQAGLSIPALHFACSLAQLYDDVLLDPIET